MAMQEPSFSALDRHAVLTGANDSFPWFASQILKSIFVPSAQIVRFSVRKFTPASTLSLRRAMSHDEAGR